MGKPLGWFHERPYPRLRVCDSVVPDLRPPLEPDHLRDLSLASFGEVQDALDACAELFDYCRHDRLIDI